VQQVCNNYGQLHGEDVIEIGSKENWYNIFARSSNRPFEHGRPQLKDLRHELPLSRIFHNSTLIVHKASSKHRTFNLESVTDLKGDIFHYDDNNNLIKNGKIIGPTTTPQFLADVYDAENVISTDTSALHFREGLGLPVTAIFGSFDARSRVKYYGYTSVLQTKTDCKEAPCHRANSSSCPYQTDYYPPCLAQIQLS
jgi:hypothetical protein